MENLTGRRAKISGWGRSRWAGLALVGVVFALAAALSWRRWADVLVDFGMQLYLPWRISEGEVLYRDMMYLTGGPLSQYFNALLFKIFGVSFRTLIFANLAITAGMLVLVYRRFLAAADRLTATMICLGIVLVFAFQHSGLIGNYNYITPYCHEVFHGLVLSIVVVAWLSSWMEKERIQFALAAGFGSGLVFLTKPDIFMALAVCAGAAFIAGCFLQTNRFYGEIIGGIFACRAGPIVEFFCAVPAGGRLAGECAFGGFGVDAVMAYVHYPGYILSVVPGIGHAVSLSRKNVGAFYFHCGGNHNLRPGVPARDGIKVQVDKTVVDGLAVVGCSTFGFGGGFDWGECGRSLPLLGLSACGLLAMKCRNAATRPAAIFPLLWNVFGLVLLAKLGFFTRISHYGFALAMPAFAGAVYLFVWLLPLWLEQRCQVRFRLFRATAGLVLMTGFVHLFLRSESYYLKKNVPVGRGGDKIMAYGPAVDPFHGRVEAALSWVQTNVPPEATLAVLPEGAMINYLSRHVNPTPHLFWVPPVMAVFGQTNMAAAFEKNSPDYVVIIARNTSEFGVGFFGYYRGYGTELMQWIDDHYDRVYPVDSTGKPPFGNRPFFGLQILKRRSAT